LVVSENCVVLVGDDGGLRRYFDEDIACATTLESLVLFQEKP
jgi:hypothetical protein